jgi:hypothetical protein
MLFMSGLQIFNAHPALYWGKSSYSGRPPLLEIGVREGGEGGMMGVTRIFGREFDTTGVLGLSRDDGRLYAQAFPDWMAIPSHQWLSMARSWHFFFAWVFVINGLCYGLFDLEPTPRAISRPPAVSFGRSGSRFAITCASGIRPARRRSATTCCRRSPTLSSSSCCCH